MSSGQSGNWLKTPKELLQLIPSHQRLLALLLVLLLGLVLLLLLQHQQYERQLSAGSGENQQNVELVVKVIREGCAEENISGELRIPLGRAEIEVLNVSDTQKGASPTLYSVQAKLGLLSSLLQEAHTSEKEVGTNDG